MTEPTPTAALPVRRTPRWVWITLLLSLALNLIVVGMAAAALLHFRKHHGSPGGHFSQFVHTLPTDRRDTLAPLLADQRAAIRPLRQKARQAHRRIREVFSAEPFDPERLSQTLREVADARTDLARARGEWVTKIAVQMTASERRDYLNWRKRYRHRRFWRRHQRREFKE